MDWLVYILIGLVVSVTILMTGLVKKQMWWYTNKELEYYNRSNEPDMFNWGLVACVFGALWPFAGMGALICLVVAGVIKALDVAAKRIAKAIITINKVTEGE